MNKIILLAGLTILSSLLNFSHASAEDTPQSLRAKAVAAFNSGNYLEALEVVKKPALDPATTDEEAEQDLSLAKNCLERLGRHDELDALLEDVISKHQDKWKLLTSTAKIYCHELQHVGYIVAGQFYRGYRRSGDGQYVTSLSRDRARALQLMSQAMPLVQAQDNRRNLAQFYLDLAEMLSTPQDAEQYWLLQRLTDLTKLPDYEEYRYYRQGSTRGLPVDAQGRPVYFHTPQGWDRAANDGERWRWALEQAKRMSEEGRKRADLIFARFLHRHFGVETILDRPIRPGREKGRKEEAESGPYAVSQLKDNETIARLATGIKRFTLPDEFNYIKILEHLAASGEDGSYAQPALSLLAQIFENRRQFSRAAQYWQENIKRFGATAEKTEHLSQIVGAWGRFENSGPKPAGQKAALHYRFRNGTSVQFEAYEIKIDKLLSDIKEYLKSNPVQLDYSKIQLANIGYRLVNEQASDYLGEKAASWREVLQPRENHFDKLITVETPLQKPGAYLVTATIAGGNTSRIIAWLDDTVIIRKPLSGKTLYYVADAISGKPLEGITLELFAYRVKQIESDVLNKLLVKRRYNVETKEAVLFTNKDGQAVSELSSATNPYQWLAIARNKEGRLAFLGFSAIWEESYSDRPYNETKAFVITDRPVYRPNQAVKFKVWARTASYAETEDSALSHKPFEVEIYNPKGEKVFEQTYQSDGFGGFTGEFGLASDAALGVYSIQISGGRRYRGGMSFRVEEYKKPEFEVTVEAPREPVTLGDTVNALIKARYYFGAPVSEAKVKYKVLRYDHVEQWYPAGSWDWLYGRGYWWFAHDYEWYPGWNRWGSRAPYPWWWNRPSNPPELVSEHEAPIGADGTLKVSIDTSVAKELFGGQDQKYEIIAEVVDQSRRTIVGTGEILAAKQPFKVYAWVERGYYSAGDTVEASFLAQTLDNKPVAGRGRLKLFRISYDSAGKPQEKEVQKWALDTDAQGQARLKFKASEAGQYRLSYAVTDTKDRSVEGGYLLTIRGAGSGDFRFNELELLPDKREYQPGQKVKLLINSNRPDATVLLFVRPLNGVYLMPQVLSLKGKSIVQEIEVTRNDMPNFFVEAVTVLDGKVFTESREIAVPPEKKILNLEVIPSAEEYRPAEKAKIKVRLTDLSGKPYAKAALALTIYDQALEYISGGSNVAEVKTFFWSWRRRHSPVTLSSLDRMFSECLKNNETGMRPIGVFGESVVDEEQHEGRGFRAKSLPGKLREESYADVALSGEVMSAALPSSPAMAVEREASDQAASPAGRPKVEPMVRKDFADTALWVGALETDALGVAQVELKMPDNLSSWKVKVWAMGRETQVGEAQTEVVTNKKLLLRLQAPRFFLEKDEAVLSANIHNYLSRTEEVEAGLELEGGNLEILGEPGKTIRINPGGESRVDWRVKVAKEGEALIRMKALSATESDAMEMRFPVYVHGMPKTEAQSGALRAEQTKTSFMIDVPNERRPEQTRLEIRYSPSLALAMVDALPYLASYPYGCSEQTLNRFLPAVITQKILINMGVNLEEIKAKRSNLNAQELGVDSERAAQWKRYDQNPVFDEKEVREMVKQGVMRLANMQLSDGGWGWFSGHGEVSTPHSTAYVVHGLQIAQENDVQVPAGVLSQGLSWLEHYEASQVQELKNASSQTKPWKDRADNLDAFVHMVLSDAGQASAEMRDFLVRDKNALALYGKALLGLSLHRQGRKDKAAAVLKNIEQYLVHDQENQTAYLKMGNESYWWYWYGSEFEAHAYYLKLLTRLEPKSEKAARLVKYLLNNRKHATYWNSTRDTALVLEAFADYLKTSGEAEPDLNFEIYLDGQKKKEVKINRANIFTFDNQLVIEGPGLSSGGHTIEIRKVGRGPLYFNAYLTNFTLEDFIKSAGLEIKVKRAYYKLERAAKSVPVQGASGQVIEEAVEKFERIPLPSDSVLKSGDLVEIELEIDSKNDYEYLVFEDMKPAGFEPIQVQSGYSYNDLHAYMELRDNRVAFFVQRLARGKHSLSYRMRAEVPGRFSALPTRGYAMYAPELKANSDEIKLEVRD